MWLFLTVVAIAAATYYIIKTQTYWKRQGVPQGSLTYCIMEFINLFVQKRSFTETVELEYSNFPGRRYSGLYQMTMPILMIRDPELLKEMTVKNFDHFPDHMNFISETAEPLWARNLFSLKGEKWREMRSILSPSFTSSKMRTIYTLISDCAQNFVDFYSKKNQPILEIELKDSFTRFTNDVIASAAFGIKTDSLENQDNQFYEMGKEITNFKSEFLDYVKFFVISILPQLNEFLQFRLFKEESSRFFIELIDSTVNTRKEKGIVRPDMIHLLIEAQKGLENKEVQVEDSSFAAQNEHDLGKAVQQKELTNLDIAAQAMIFFFAGFESVSGLMCFMGYELAINQDIQKKLRDEIVETFENCQGQLTYETLLKMKYMDMVVSEALRKWPTGVETDRECTKPFTIEPKLPGEKPLHLKQGAIFWVPIYGIHRDPNIYPDPLKFDPERFSDENKGNINPYNYIPFGLGPRNCIGSRFALLEIKTVFFHLLKNFELVPTAKSTIPVKLSTKTFNLTAEDGFWFGLKKLNQ